MEYDSQTMLYKIPKKDEQNEHLYEIEVKKDKFWLDIFNKSKLRILGENFCRNNKNKGKLIINNKKSSMKDTIPANKNKIKISLLLNKNISNKSEMFKDCKYLQTISIIDTSKNSEDIQNEYLYEFEEKKEQEKNINYDFQKEDDKFSLSLYEDFEYTNILDSSKIESNRSQSSENSTLLK